MRALFTCSLGVGHLHPLVPIARALEDPGHEVAFASPSPLASAVQRSGFRAFSAGMPQTASEAFPEFRTLRGREEMIFTSTRIRPAQALVMAQDLLGIISDWEPDLVIRETSEFGGCIAAERLDIPYAVVEVQAAGYSAESRSLLSEGLSLVLARHGLSPDPDLAILDRHAVVSPFPPSYRGVPVRIADTPWLSIRPTPFDQSGDERPPAWLDEMSEHPIAYLTLGTSLAFNARPKIFRAFIDGLADEPLNLIIALGRNNDPADFRPIPSNVRIEHYIPQTLVFPRCNVVISHAGSGTVMAALAHGLPLVLIPIAADQPSNALRCADLGLARVLDEDDLDPALAQKTVLEVMREPSYCQNSEQMRAEIEGLPGPEQAVVLFERLAAREI